MIAKGGLFGGGKPASGEREKGDGDGGWIL
jgi:hypothetical protein